MLKSINTSQRSISSAKITPHSNSNNNNNTEGQSKTAASHSRSHIKRVVAQILNGTLAQLYFISLFLFSLVFFVAFGLFATAAAANSRLLLQLELLQL